MNFYEDKFTGHKKAQMMMNQEKEHILAMILMNLVLAM